MIRGAFTARGEAIVTLRLRGPGGFEILVDAAIDTGFNASLTLPLEEVAVLGLPYESSSHAILADGAVARFDVYLAEVYWGSAWRTVAISVVGEEVLLGMRLLAGHRLRIDAVPGGLVEITPLP